MTRFLYTAKLDSAKGDHTLGEIRGENRIFGHFIKDKNYVVYLDGKKIFASGFYKIEYCYYKGKKQLSRFIGLGYFKFQVEKHIAKKYLQFLEKTEVKTKNSKF